MNSRVFRLLPFLAVVCFVVLAGFTSVSAQPSEAQIRKDISTPETVSITFGQPRSRAWSSTYKKFMWTRNVTVKKKTEERGVFALISGYVAYDVVGTKYTFWRTFTSSNSYEGIPNPSESDIQALIKKFGLEKIMGYRYGERVGEVESMVLSDDPKFEWHSTQSVSLNVNATYTEKTSGGMQRGVRSFRIRLYADEPKGEWVRLANMSAGEMKPL